MKRLILIDGNSLMFRAYYATAYRGRMMQNRNGIYTNAIFAFVNMMEPLLETEFDNIFIAFDAGSKTIRHQAYDEYKAGRKEFPDELGMQVPYIHRYLDILNIKRSQMDNYEADDLIASLAHQAYDEFDAIHIISGDKDLLQLVNDKVSVFLTRQGLSELEEHNVDNFYELNEIYPHQVIDYKGLVGDPSDNLPGIKGIGHKTAVKLLNEFNNLEGIYDNVDKLTKRQKEMIVESFDVGLRCRELATLHMDVNLDFSIEDTKREDYDVDELIDLYKELDFTAFLKRLDKDHNEINLESYEYEIIEDVSMDLSDILDIDSFVIAEVFSSNYLTGEFLGLGVANEKGNFFITKEVVKNNKSVIGFLEDGNINKSTFDYKQLYVVLKNEGINIKGVSFDLLLGIYLLDPSKAAEDIKTATNDYVDSDIVFYENIYGSNTKAKIPELEVYSKYALDKAILVSQLEDRIKSKLEKNKVDDLLYKCELPLSEVLGDMEINGLKVDLDSLDRIGVELTQSLDEISQDIYALAGEEFNINSVKQLGEVLFEKLGLPVIKKTKTGNYSTNAEVLEKLAVEYYIAQRILDYRSVNKLITTYINGLKEVTNENSFVHPLYKQALTITGRLSSVEPNIQNIPIRTEMGQQIRDVFVSRFDDGYIVSADYSQIELRVLAHLSNEQKMIKAFNDGFDFHSKTATQLFDVNINDVTSDQRRVAKTINFGIIYGMSAWGLSESLKISPVEAANYIERYFNEYPKVKDYLNNTVTEAKEKGYTKTILNRRRYIPELHNNNRNILEFGKRTAMNAPIQGSAADIIKLAMVEIQRKFQDYQLESYIIAQVHDELLFDVKADELLIVEKIATEVMENIISLKVDLKVDINRGRSWLEAK